MPPLSGKAKHSMPLNAASYFTAKAAKCKVPAVAPILRLFLRKGFAHRRAMRYNKFCVPPAFGRTLLIHLTAPLRRPIYERNILWISFRPLLPSSAKTPGTLKTSCICSTRATPSPLSPATAGAPRCNGRYLSAHARRAPQYLRGLEERREAVKKSIDEQGKLTDELAAAIDSAKTLAEVEDLYRPLQAKAPHPRHDGEGKGP